jgi:hypothetical protein
MTFLPALLRLRVRRMPSLWLPLFLLWPLVFLLLLLLFLTLVVLGAQRDARRVPAWDSLAAVFRLLCAARGTRIDIGDPSPVVALSIH